MESRAHAIVVTLHGDHHAQVHDQKRPRGRAACNAVDQAAHHVAHRQQRQPLASTSVVPEDNRAHACPCRDRTIRREVRDFDDERWAEERYRIVVKGNLAKFAQADGSNTRRSGGTGSSMPAEARPVRNPANSCLSTEIAPCIRRLISLRS